MDDNWHRNLDPWAKRNAIRILPIAKQCVPPSTDFASCLSSSCVFSVADAFRNEFKNLSDSLDLKQHTAGYEVIPVDVHVPILNLPDLPDKSGRKILSTAGIQGSFGDRRVYDVIFQDLNRSLHG